LKVLGIALLLFVACSPAVEKTSSAPETPTSSSMPSSTSTAVPDTTPVTETIVEEMTPEEDSTPQAGKERNITISGVEVANPLVVSGLARTFENNVVLRARAADGSVIVEGFTTATGEMGQHSPYRGSLWLTRQPGNRIIVEALEYSAKDGSETNLTRVERPFNVAPVEATLYFADENCTGVKPYTRRIPKSISMARLLVEALVDGPTADERTHGAAVSFPEHSAVQSVILRNGTLTVDFNERLQNVGGSCRAQMIRASVTETLRRLPAVKSVVITAGGSEKLALQP
jgi:Immunoglobulin-like domain of bacterial spore germination/Sporulation and spore germination